MTQYWFNTRTSQVEETEERGPNRDVLGPFDTREEAERAIEIARRRTEEWDREDAAWEGRDVED